MVTVSKMISLPAQRAGPRPAQGLPCEGGIGAAAAAGRTRWFLWQGSVTDCR